MTKKKSKGGDQGQNFQPPKSKNLPQNSSIAKNRNDRNSRKILQKRKEQRYNSQKYITENRRQKRLQQQKNFEHLIQKKMEQERKLFKSLRYDDQLNSQLGQIGQESAEKRWENQTIQKMKEILQSQELNQNKILLSTQAEIQFAKIQQFTQSLQEKSHLQQKDSSRRNDHNQFERQLVYDLPIIFHKQNQVQKQESQPKNIIQKINQLQQIYY